MRKKRYKSSKQKDKKGVYRSQKKVNNKAHYWASVTNFLNLQRKNKTVLLKQDKDDILN